PAAPRTCLRSRGRGPLPHGREPKAPWTLQATTASPMRSGSNRSPGRVSRAPRLLPREHETLAETLVESWWKPWLKRFRRGSRRGSGTESDENREDNRSPVPRAAGPPSPLPIATRQTQSTTSLGAGRRRPDLDASEHSGVYVALAAQHCR